MFFQVLIKSLIIGALGGAAVSAGAARMFHAPEIQAMGAFRTLGEINACKGDPVSHFSFGLGFFFNAAGSVIGAGALTQDVLHRIVPNWAAAALLVKNKKVEETLYDPARMGVMGAIIGAVVVAALNLLANAIPESLAVIASGILSPAANLMINKITGIWGTVLGGLAYLIMGNAVPGCVLGIIVGQSVEDSGYNKTVQIMLAVIAALFIVIGIGRGFWGKLILAFSNFLG